MNQANAQAAKLKLKRQESRNKNNINKTSTNRHYYQTTTDDHNFNLLAPSSSRSQSSSAISSLALPELSTSTKAYATLALLSILLAWYQFFAQLQTCSSLLVVAFLGVCINKYADGDDEDNDNKSDVKGGGKEDKSADGKASPSDESLQNGTNINDRSSPSVSKGKRSPTDADSGVECNDELVRLSADASSGDNPTSNLRRQQLLAKTKRRPAELKASSLSTNSVGNTQGGNDMWLLTRRLTSALQLLKASSTQQQTGGDVRLASVSSRSTPSPAHSVSLKQANTSSINSSNHEDYNDNDNDCHGQEQQMIQQHQPLLNQQPKTALTIMMDEISMGNCSDRCTMSTSNMNQTYQSNNTSFGTDV